MEDVLVAGDVLASQSRSGVMTARVGGADAYALSFPEAAMLQVARSAHPFEEMIRACGAAIGVDTGDPHDYEALATALRSLIDRQLVVRLPEVIARRRVVESAPSTSKKEPIQIGIPTRDRPEAVLACLAALATAARADGRFLHVTVVDDSADLDSDRLRRAINVAAWLRDVLAVTVVSRRDRQRLARDWAELAEVDPVIARWLLVPDVEGVSSLGGARNTLLLLSAGQRVLQLDDDVLWQVRQAADVAPGSVCDEAWDGMATRVFRSRESAAASLQPTAARVFDAVEQWLGIRMLDVFETPGLTLRRLSREWLDECRAPEARLAAVHLGLYGDCAKDTPLGRVFEPRLGRSDPPPCTAAEWLSSREVTEVASRTTISRPVACRAYAMALDCCGVLPPFFPIGRDEDLVFAVMMRATLRGGGVSTLPYAVCHAPAPRPPFSAEPARSRVRRISDVVVSVIGATTHPRFLSPEARLESLGLGFSNIARAPDMTATFADLLMRSDCGRLLGIQCAMDADPPLPAECHTQVVAHQHAFATSGLDALVFEESSGQDSLRRILRLWGEGLKSWAALWTASGKMRVQAALTSP
jgi:hypothetical protein